MAAAHAMSPTKLRALAETDVRYPIATEQLLQALQTPPFIDVPGLFNTRDLGLLSLCDCDSGSAGGGGEAKAKGIRPGFLFRTGSLQHLHGNPKGQAVLRDQLGVRRIFDLRSKQEHSIGPDPIIEGVDSIWEVASSLEERSGTTTTTEEAAKVDLKWFVNGEGEAGYVAMYMEVLGSYVGIFREVLKSVRDRPGEPLLFHCTAGRDRTGVLAGLLESLAGYDARIIQTDFLLSRIGYEPAREQLIRFALDGTGVDAANIPDLAQLFDSVPGFYNLASLKPIYWDAFVQAVDKQYGGFEGYATQVLGFSEDDLTTIRKNLTQAP